MNVFHGIAFHKKAVMPIKNNMLPAKNNTNDVFCEARESFTPKNAANTKNKKPVAVMRLLLHVRGYV